MKTLIYKEQHSPEETHKDLATVYFFRIKNLNGVNFVIHDKLNENNTITDSTIGILSSSSFFQVNLKPGIHLFSYSDAWKRNFPELEIKLERAKKYYIVMNEVRGRSYMTNPYTHVVTSKGALGIADEIIARKLIPQLLEIDLVANKNLYVK